MTFKANDSLTEQIAQYLGKKIIQGEMAPGERIQELRIAAELEVSRGSVREALLILQRRHLVEIFPRRGAVVSSISGQDVGDFFELWFMLLDRVVSNLATSWKNDDLARFFELMTQLAECHRQDDMPGYFDSGVGIPARAVRLLQQPLHERGLARPAAADPALPLRHPACR